MARVFLIGFLSVLIALASSSVHANDLQTGLMGEASGINPMVMSLALNAARCANQEEGKNSRYLTVIDYSKPSTEPRLWLFDLKTNSLVFEELVAHGRNTGENYARHFSNINGSKQSSMGLFRTGNTYYGKHGLSLRLHGLEPGINDKAFERAIVMHGADYVSDDFVKKHGRLGRSWGCPAVRREVAKKVINMIKEDQLLFIYHPSTSWLDSSKFLSCGASNPGI